MKNYFWILPAAVMLLVSCEKHYDTPDPVDPTEPVIPPTAVTFNGIFTGSAPWQWYAGDAIGVFKLTEGATVTNAKANLSKITGAGTGLFTAPDIAMAPEGNVFYLYYPYDNRTGGSDPAAVHFFENSGTPFITGVLPYEQQQVVAGDLSHRKRYEYAVAASEPVAKGQEPAFSMHRIMAHLQLNLWSSSASLDGYTIDQIKIEAPENNYLSGLFKADFAGNYTAMTGNPSDFSRSVNLSIENTGPMAATEGGAQPFLATILPIDLTGKDLTVTVTISKAGKTHLLRKIFNGLVFTGAETISVAGDISDWKLASPVSTNAANLLFMAHLAELEQLAIAYSALNPKTTYTPTHKDWLVMSYIRKFGGYTSSNWASTGGAIDNNFTTYVVTNNPSLNTYFSTTASQITGMDNGQVVDLRHMAATMTASMYSSAVYLKDLAGWAGDLVTFLIEGVRGNTANQSEAFYYQWALGNMGKSNTTYSMEDLLGDTDALNIYIIMMDNGLGIAAAFDYYYSHSSGYLKRFTSFAGDDKDVFLAKTIQYTKISTPSILLYMSLNFMSITANQTNGFANGYTDFIFNLAAQE